MCLSPIELVNPKRKISLYGGIPYKITVPCGKCAECQKVKQSEWYFRAYYESKYTFDNGGYIYFDTLTYSNEYLPHVSDFFPELKGHIADYSCFNVDHYRYFLVNLRRQLEYHGFDVKNKLKYFLCSEYGVDDRFTHRPHYHIIFYVLDNSLSPVELSRYISKCWKYGRTDGVDYKGVLYVLNHTFGKKYNNDEVHMQTVCNYVAKYVTKDSRFQKTIDSRIKIVSDKRYGYGLSERQEKLLNDIKRNMNQFHRQSHHFGEAFYLYNDPDKVLETGMISMPDKNNIVKHIPLPSYYSRKIFYNLVRDFEGRLKWEINDIGVRYKLSHMLKSIDLFVKKFQDWLVNMKNKNMSLEVGYIDDEGHRWLQHEVDEWYRDNIDKFENLLNGRDIKEFVIYLLCYKGRIKSQEQVVRESNGIYKVDPIDEFVMRPYDVEQDFGVKQVYNYAHYIYKRSFGQSFVTDKDLGDTFSWRNDGLKDMNLASWMLYSHSIKEDYGFVPSLVNSYSKQTRKYKFGNCISSDLFASRYVIDDSSDEKFKDFDKMYWIWCNSLKYVNIQKQKIHDWKLEQRDKYKKAGMYVKNI